jgi:DedD protein
LETRAKERLTGAVILVAVIVLLVPELLSGPAHAPSVRGAPSEELPVRSYTMDLSDESRSGAPSSAGSAAPTMPRMGADEPAAPPAAPAADADASPLPPAGTAMGPSGPSTGMAPRAAAAAASAVAPASVAPADSAPVVSAPAAAPAAATHAAVAAGGGHDGNTAGGGWVVQLGSFASRANAEHLVGDLKGRGFSAFVSEASGGGRKWYRVRVGPEHERAAALVLAGRLHAGGHPGSVVPAP